MKISLINPPFIQGFNRSVRGSGEAARGGTLYYPIWLSYAAGLLEEEHEVHLTDAQAKQWSHDTLVRDLTLKDPDLVIVDTNFSSLNHDINTVSLIKEQLPDTTTVVVGPPASQYTDVMLASKGVDIVAKYEYDYTLLEIASALESGKAIEKVRGISYREGSKIIHNPVRDFTTNEDLDKIPFVSKVYKKHLNINDYFLSSSLYPMVQIFTGRGCPNKCTFCSWPQTLTGRTYRYRSTSNLLDELEWIQNNLQVKEIFFEDDTFTVNKKRVIEFCQEYKNRGLKIAWSCNARANTLDLETMHEMRRSNCRLLITGYESGSDEILKNIRKGVTVEQMQKFASNAKKARLMVHGDFIIGLPGETEETIELTRKLIRELKPELLQVLIPQPIPGTELYEWYKDNACLTCDDPNKYIDENGYQKPVISLPGLSQEEMVQVANTTLKEYYLSLNYVPLVMRQIVRKNGLSELKRLYHSAKMFLGYVGEN